MNRYILIRRLRLPAILLLIGVVALLHQAGAIDHFWHLFWPLLFILVGVMLLAERAALNADGGYTAMPYPGAPYAGAVDPNAPAVEPPAPEIAPFAPTHTEEYEKHSEGEQS